MVKMKVDTRGLTRKIAAMRAASPEALEAVDRKVADTVMSEVILDSPKDTNRYVRGMAMAANDAGLGPFTVPPIKAGRFAAEAKVRLERQVRKWEWIVRQYETKGRTKDKFYKKAVKTLGRAKEELAKWNPRAIIIFGGKGRLLEVTVRDKVYGGTGVKLVLNGIVRFVMHNKEPHASIVESRSRVLKGAMAKARRFGLRLGGRAYVRRMQQASGVGIGGGRGRGS